MADNITLNAGTGGSTLAADDVSSVWYQRIKLTDGTADSSTPINSGNGTSTNALRVTLSSDSTGVVAVTDNAGSLTVDGTVAATQSGTWTVQPGNTANTTAWKVDASSVAVPITDNSGSLTVDYATTGSGNATGALRVELANNGTGVLATVGAVTAITNALPAGTNAIGKLASNTGVTIGAVEIAAAQTLATVSTVTTCSTLTGGGVAHDGADSGNPVKIGVKAETSPKGITVVADGDRTDLYADADGMLMVKLATSGADLISENVSNTNGTSTAFSNFTAVASTYNYVTAYSVFRTDAGTTPIYVDFRDGTAGAIKWSVVLPPNGGANMSSAIPLFKTSANTALAYDVSAATTTVYISVSGYQSKV